MIKLLSLCLVIPLFFTSTGSANTDSDFLDGCYKTLEINGRSVLPGPDEVRSHSMIYSVQNEFFYDLESRQSLKTKVLSLFTNFNGGWYSFTNGLMFEDLGSLEASGDSLNYAFDGEVYYLNRYHAMDKVDFKTQINLQKHSGIVSGLIQQSSLALDRSIQMQVILKQVECVQ